MDPVTMGETIVRLETKVDTVIETLAKVSNGAGFPRCVRHDERLKAVEGWQNKKDTAIAWLQRTVYGAAIAAWIKVLLFDLPKVFAG